VLLVITVGCIPKASRMLFHLVVFTTARGAGPMAILLWHIMNCNNHNNNYKVCGVLGDPKGVRTCCLQGGMLWVP
jgi:hypothetical protein